MGSSWNLFDSFSLRWAVSSLLYAFVVKGSEGDVGIIYMQNLGLPQGSGFLSLELYAKSL